MTRGVGQGSNGNLRLVGRRNHLHHLWLAGWQERFPEAAVWYPPGLAKKRPSLRLDHELAEVTESPWPELDLVVLRGSVWMDEVLFLHRPSKALLVTDVFQNHDPARDGWFWRAVKSMVGIQGPEGGAPIDWRMSVRDKEAARQAVRSVLAWDFDRMVVAHGLCIERGAKEQFARAFDWLGL